jgi:hypothetical protein
MDFREVEWRGIDCINLAQDRAVAGSFECGYEPLGSIKCGKFLE